MAWILNDILFVIIIFILFYLFTLFIILFILFINLFIYNLFQSTMVSKALSL